MKTKVFHSLIRVEKIQKELQKMIDSGEVQEVISFSLTSYYDSSITFGGDRFVAILIYK